MIRHSRRMLPKNTPPGWNSAASCFTNSQITVGRLLEGILLRKLARYDEAEQLIKESIQGLSLEALPHGYMHLGHLNGDRGNYDEAEKWYRKVVELDPDNAGPHIFLGAVLAARGDLQQAEACHRKATRCSKGRVDEAYLNLGLVIRAQELIGLLNAGHKVGATAYRSEGEGRLRPFNAFAPVAWLASASCPPRSIPVPFISRSSKLSPARYPIASTAETSKWRRSCAQTRALDAGQFRGDQERPPYPTAQCLQPGWGQLASFVCHRPGYRR